MSDYGGCTTTTYPSNPLLNIKIREVENGFIVSDNVQPGYVSNEYVFKSLVDLHGWMVEKISKR